MEGCFQLRKTTFRIIISLMFIIILFSPCFTCFAAEEKDNLFSNDKVVDFKDAYEKHMRLQVLDEKYTGNGILEGIFVSRNGWFVLVFAEATQHHINIFDQACQFKRHIVIKESGTLLAMFDESDNHVVLFPIRDHVLIKIDEEGNYLSAWSMENDILSELVDKLSALNDFEIEAAGNVYSFHRKNILSKDSQAFYVTDSEGEYVYSYAPGIDIADKNFILNGILLLLSYFVVSKNFLKKRENIN